MREAAAAKVSVCIPTYNTGRYLREAIESVLQQTWSDYELIICDNASTDNTREICSRYKDPRIRYVRFEQLVTQGGNWNRCIDLARGEYVALLHADDKYLPDFVEQRVQALDADPSIGLAFGAVETIDEDGNSIGQQFCGGEAFLRGAPEFFKELLFGCVISPVSPMVRRGCYEEVGGFNEERLWGVDWEMWLRIAARYTVSYSPRIVACYRIHPTSGTSVGLLEAKNGAEDLAVLQRAFEEAKNHPQLSRVIALRKPAFRKLALRTLYAAGYNCEHGQMSGLRQNLRFVMRTDPSLVSRPTLWALGASGFFGSWVYRAFRRLRPL